MKAISYILLFIPCLSFGQAKIVLNGGVININNNAFVVVENSAPDAIIRTSGYIDSEGADNNLKWGIGSAIGTYIVPFGTPSNYIPLTFTKTQNTGAGDFVFATYPTANWQNSASLPATVSDVNDAFGTDLSDKIIDRFWKMKANYAVKPNLFDVEFTYIDNEHNVASNNITEYLLLAERWNSGLSTWNDMPPTGDINTVNNTLTIPNLNAANLFDWWTLISFGVKLPIELTEFSGDCDQNQIDLNWTTASEQNNQQFDVEVSQDGKEWLLRSSMHGSGNSSHEINYAFTDSNPLFSVNYYRLKQIDINGVFTYSDPIFVSCNSDQEAVTIFPNPNTGSFGFSSTAKGIYTVTNELGQVIHQINQVHANTQYIMIEDLTPGIYFIYGPQNSTIPITKMIVSQ